MSRGLSRRSFLKRSGGVAVLGTVGATQLLSRQKARAAAWMLPDTAQEYPSSGQISTMTAIADTIIPNWDGAPGAIESGAINTLNDPYYGVNPYISELCSDIDAWAATFWVYGRSFLGLDNSERDDCIAERLGYDWAWPASLYKDAYLGCIALTKLNYFGGLVNSRGMDYIGFPGANEGYAPQGASGAYTMVGGPVAIPDNNATGITSTITVSGTGAVKDCRVTVCIWHSYQGDLVVKLQAPDGTQHTLWNRAGGSADNVILYDVAVPTCVGKTAAGSWRLIVQDLAGADTGSLMHWGVKLRCKGEGPAMLPSTDTPKPINDLTTTSSYLSSSVTGAITSLKIRMFLTHTWRGDLVVNLVSPAGTVVNLWNRTGGSADDLLLNNVAITACNGQSASGTWRLDVQDAAGGDVGTLQSWGLEILTADV